MLLNNKFFVLRYHRPKSNMWSAYGIDPSGFYSSYLTTDQLIKSHHYIFTFNQLLKLDNSRLATPGAFGYDPKYQGRKVIPTDNFIRDRRPLIKDMAINNK